MNASHLTRRTRRALGAVVAAGALGCATTAIAGPTFSVAASWNQPVSATAGGYWTSADGGSTIQGKANADYPASAALTSGYCNPYGANTQLVGATITRVRWQGNASDMSAFMRFITPAGTDLGVEGGLTSLKSTRRYLYDYSPEGINLQLSASTLTSDTYTFPGGQCVHGGVLFNGAGSDGVTDASGFTPLMTNQLNTVTVEDLQGPAVSGATSPASWITGDSAPIEWDHSDNALNRGTTGAAVTGGATVDLGDPANGHAAASVGVGALTDGQQQVCAYRKAPAGYATASACAAFKLDRTNPASPAITLSPDTGGAWTNQDVLVQTAATADGTGSGWDRNQFSVDGVNFTDAAAAFTRTQEGDVTLKARAVDKAGRASTPSEGRVVRIDKTSPVAPTPGAWTATPTADPFAFTVALPSLADALSGLARVEVLANTDPNGGQLDGDFVPAGSVTDPAGSVSLVADLAGMAGGTHATRIVATDRAGNTFVTSGPIVPLDAALPTVSPIVINANGTVSFTMSDASGFGACPVKIDINGPATNGAWQNVFTQAAGTLPANFTYQLPMAGLANGDYQVRTSVCDALGNTTTQVKTFSWQSSTNTTTPASIGGAATPPPFHVTEIRSDVQYATRLVNGVVLPVIRGNYNRTFVLRGHLQRADGLPLTFVGLELRDSAGRYVTGTRTDAAGNFSVPARATIGGLWTVNQLGQTSRTAVALLEVRPLVQIRMSMKRVNGARRLVAAGRLIPQAGAYNKALQLQWRDPKTKAWRPAVNGRIAKNGRFRLVYQFRRPGGYRVAFRLVVPQDNGWPYLAATSRTVTVRV